MQSPFSNDGRFGVMTPTLAPRPVLPMPRAGKGSGSHQNSAAALQEGADEGVRVEKIPAYNLQAQDVVRGRAKVDGEDRVVVVTRGRVVLVPPAALTRTIPVFAAVAAAPGSGTPDPAARKKKLAFGAGITLAVLSTVGSVVAGVLAERSMKAARAVDSSEEDAAPWDPGE